ncbi:dynein associated protein-domain-containing protein [Polychytrium aggregatum]|uniref:dynein associated protein-domain-containing protein n=1 Tax=Polychytrium aggregatum TaxID=110093 RepID=UPI0022FED718|nr:dynein associated protein-domain-containing protein [Polychytrium aggregatum]KAI9202529.1 dynein associated protein-domain-containing protein [Polychytrium aggregatum]
MADDSTPIPSHLALGNRVQINGIGATIRFVGATAFATGRWVGLELDAETGKNDGSVQGKRYFECKPGYGVFVRANQIRAPHDDQNAATTTTPGRRASLSARLSVGPGSLPRSFAPPPAPPSSTSPPSSSPKVDSSRPASPARTLGRSASGTLPKSTSTPGARLKGSAMSQALALANSLAVSSSTSPSMPSSLPFDPSLGPSTPTPAAGRPRPVSMFGRLPTRPADPETPVPHESLELETPIPIPDSPVSDEAFPDYSSSHISPGNLPHVSNPSLASNPPDATATSPAPAPTSERHDQAELDPTQSASGSHESVLQKMVSNREVDDLKIKLRILETKRAEDKERLKDIDRLRSELEASLEIRTKLSSRLQESQNDVRDAKRQIRDITNERNLLEEQLVEAQEELEMMTLDKEMAEEKADALHAEVEALQGRCEELMVDVEVLKEEAELIRIESSGGISDSPSSRPALEYRQLERQNERLTVALIRLRDVTTETESELRHTIALLEKENMHLADQKLKDDQLKKQIEDYEQQVEALKEELDEALSAEEMIVSLTDKNMALHEKIEQMKVAISDLEDLKAVADELEEGHVETENQLQEVIDFKDMVINELKRRYDEQQESLIDYEGTIVRFRELVKTLQSELEELRGGSADDEGDKLVVHSQEILSLNMQLQSTVTKAQTKAIDLELKKLDALQAATHLQFVTRYLPESFFDNEDDAIQCELIFQRLNFKADLVQKILKERFQIGSQFNDPQSHNAHATADGLLFGGVINRKLSKDGAKDEQEWDHQTYICEMVQRLVYYNSIVKRFMSYLESCSVDEYLKIGKIHHDLVGAERRLNGLVELLKRDEVRGVHILTDIGKSISQMEHLSETLLVSDFGVRSTVAQSIITSYLEGMDIGSERIDAELEKLSVWFERHEDEDNDFERSFRSISGDVLDILRSALTQNKGAKARIRKLIKRMKEIVDASSIVRYDICEFIREIYQAVARTVDYCAETSHKTVFMIKTKREHKTSISMNVFDQISASACELFLGQTEAMLGHGLCQNLDRLNIMLDKVVEAVEDGSYVEKVNKNAEPWKARAEFIRKEYSLNTDLEKKIESLNGEVITLLKDIHIKDQNIQESNIRIEFLEKRMEQSQKTAETIAALEEELSIAKTQEDAYEELIEALHGDIEHLEMEHRKLAKRLELQQQQYQQQQQQERASPPSIRKINTGIELGSAGGPPMSPLPMTPGGPGRSETPIVLDAATKEEIQALKSALKFVRAENARLKASKVQVDAEFLFDPNDALMRFSKPHSQANNGSTGKDAGDGQNAGPGGSAISPPKGSMPDLESSLRNLQSETRAFLVEAHQFASAPKVVDVTKQTSALEMKWISSRHNPAHQQQTKVESTKELVKRGTELKERIKRVSEAAHQGQPQDNLLEPLTSKNPPTPVQPLLLGRVRIPALASIIDQQSPYFGQTKGSHQLTLGSRKEFERLHTCFV